MKMIDISPVFTKGVYIERAVSIETVQNFKKLFKNYEFPIDDKLHCTIIYSQKPYTGFISLDSFKIEDVSDIIPIGYKWFGTSLVLTLDSDYLKNRNKYLMNTYHFVSDFDEYKPHITLFYETEYDIDIDGLPKINFPIHLDKEKIYELEDY